MISTRNQLLLLIFLGAFLFAWDWKFSIPPIPFPEKIVEQEPEQAILAPPETIQAIYYTASSAGSERKINQLIELTKISTINAVVIDIKDYTGYVLYDTALPDAEVYATEKILIPDVDALIGRLHEAGIYVIARMVIFQDPALAKARPDLAVKNGAGLWRDNNGLAWIDPAATDAWDYNIAIAQDALSRGFDEINVDYVRFASDGNLKAMTFPFWDRVTPRRDIVRDFFAAFRQGLGKARISADLFGFVTTQPEDFGVGQVIEDAFEYFDYVSPMVYPSHYPPGFLGFANPAAHPYEVIKHAMDGAARRLDAFRQVKKGSLARPVVIRPWLQDFDLGADYDASMVQAQIRATRESLGEDFKGFMVWNARNVYTEGAFTRN